MRRASCDSVMLRWRSTTGAEGVLTQSSCYTDSVSKRNVTLTVSEDALRRARHLAVEKGVSLSKLLSESLEQVVLRNDRYDEARRKALSRMKRGVPMGVGVRPTWTRDELHER